ncbi:cytochrome P450 6g1-like [Musca vetustissima]|uniref:cytochrome P450 6g1-like n=1 Tax=Musca vetustissima TaxID=27455 RepID=UPI002AB736C2|nr:cytochrome P450 6g1-like [Musca vetustissima]
MWYRRQFSYWKRHKTIPSVEGRIFSGCLVDTLRFKTNFGYYLKTIYDDPEFANEPLVGIYGLHEPALMVKEPQIIKSILVKHFDSFHDRFAEQDVDYDPIGGQAMFMTSYATWKEMRTKLSPLFTSAKLKTMYGLIQNVALNMERYLEKQSKVMRCDMKEFCASYTIDIIATVLLGFQSNSMENPSEELRNIIRKLTEFSGRRAFNFIIAFFVPSLARFFRSKLLYEETEHFLRTSIVQSVEERKLSGETRNDLIDILVKLTDEAKESGRDMSQFMDCLLAQVGISISAGFDTTATSMSNALLELAKQPEIQRRLKKEIKEAFEAEKGTSVSYENLSKLQYLDMVVCETLRLYPVLPILQRRYNKGMGAREGYSLKPYSDFVLPDGMTMFICTYGLHYDPKYWPEPHKFNPERFVPENKVTLLNSMTYLPFGAGPHNCIGARLAMLQLKCGLVHLLKNHYVRICDQTVVEPEFEARSFVLQVKGGMYLEIVKDGEI